MREHMTARRAFANVVEGGTTVFIWQSRIELVNGPCTANANAVVQRGQGACTSGKEGDRADYTGREKKPDGAVKRRMPAVVLLYSSRIPAVLGGVGAVLYLSIVAFLVT